MSDEASKRGSVKSAAKSKAARKNGKLGDGHARPLTPTRLERSDHVATEDGIRKLAEKLAEVEYEEGDVESVTCLEDLFERVLRESKLPQLIAAGQKMHQHAWGDHAEFAAAHKTFGLALAAFLAATGTGESR